MLAVLSPGQGAQKPGFLAPWLEAFPSAEGRLRWWSVLAGVDLVRLGTTGDAEEITDTAKTQPLLVAAALLAAESLPAGAGDPVPEGAVVAGHSVGELAAAALAGALTSDAAVALAGVRGREMAAACAAEPTGMAAVLGGDQPEVLAAIDTHGLYPANRNGAGQIVAAGADDRLAKLAASPPTGARIRRLAVAGAFHTPYMAPAEAAISTVAAGLTVADPRLILLSNLDGAAVDRGAELRRRLVAQVTAPVRWDACLATLADLGVTGVVELPPAGTLAGLVKRELPAPRRPEIVTLQTPDDLPAARELVARHGAASGHEAFPALRVAVAPAAGTFAPRPGLAEGDPVAAGDALGEVATRQGPVAVTAHHAGTLEEWLAQPADPVTPGQPLARIGASA